MKTIIIGALLITTGWFAYTGVEKTYNDHKSDKVDFRSPVTVTTSRPSLLGN